MSSCDRLGTKPDVFERKGQAWFCTNGLPSDIVIEVDSMSFHLHKFPLMSRSGRLSSLIEELRDAETCYIALADVPGGPETFELGAKFCYGMKIEITPCNVAALHCLAHYLEMTEDYGEGNLVNKTEAFLNNVVLQNWKSSVETLRGCELVLQEAERLHLVEKCIESISVKACTDPKLLGWPIREHQGLLSPGGSILWNGISTGAKYRNLPSDDAWWFEDISNLSLPFFELVMNSMEEKGIRKEAIAGAVVHYTLRYIPALTRRKTATNHSSEYVTEEDQRKIVETVEGLLPLQKGIATSKFLLGLLKRAIILNASESCRSGLEKRIAMYLEQVTLEDILIPNYSYHVETLYDVECIQRILQHFVSFQDQAPGSVFLEHHAHGAAELGVEDTCGPSPLLLTPLTKIGKLLDDFLAEVAPDANLKMEKFQSLAVSLPTSARLYDDGLYRAIDVFLQAHPWLTESERERLCSIMDCQKLTFDACTHAAQNERMPLRVIVQVLFFEQDLLRKAIAGSYIASDASDHARTSNLNASSDLGILGPLPPGGEGWNANLRVNQALRADINNIKSKVSDLERECSAMRLEIQKCKPPKEARSSWALNLISKIGCKSKSEVCESRVKIIVPSKTTEGQTVENVRKHRHRRSSSAL